MNMWTEGFRIRFFDAEPGGQASLPAICRLMEEAAHSQTESLGFSIIQVREAQRMWVLSRFSLKVFSRPSVGDGITVETWASDRTGGLRAYRDFRMRDGSGKVIAEAGSLWLLLDLTTRRPVRLPESVLAIREPDRVGEAPVDARPLIAPEASGCVDRFRIRQSDLDENGHANNIRYIEWVLDTLPRTFRPNGIDIQFLNEGLPGDQVESVAQYVSPDEARHRLQTADGCVLAIAASYSSGSSSS